MKKLKKIFMILISLTITLLLILFFIALFTTEYFAQFGAKADGKRLARIEQSVQYRNGEFHNTTITKIDWSFTDFFRIMKKFYFEDYSGEPKEKLPIVKLDKFSFAVNQAEKTKITWLGHSSCLIEIDGVRILTDPIWSERASFASIMGPKRFHPAPISIEDLPHIDAVLISHDHYDHLDMHTIQKLKDKTDKFLVPLGIGAHLEKWGVNQTQFDEFEWYDSVDVHTTGVKLICTPTRHFSGRSPIYGTNPTLWCSWVIEGENTKIYFTGDSGYDSKIFKDIGEKFGPFDVTLMAIGAYNEKWRDIHLFPDEAVTAHKELQGILMIPIHWGTFNLATHSWNEPVEWMVKDAAERNVLYFVPKVGETYINNEFYKNSYWWRKMEK